MLHEGGTVFETVFYRPKMFQKNISDLLRHFRSIKNIFEYSATSEIRIPLEIRIDFRGFTVLTMPANTRPPSIVEPLEKLLK